MGKNDLDLIKYHQGYSLLINYSMKYIQWVGLLSMEKRWMWQHQGQGKNLWQHMKDERLFRFQYLKIWHRMIKKRKRIH